MKFWLTVGRFQPLHDGHIKLIRNKLDEGKNVLVLIRNTRKSKKNPYSIFERYLMFMDKFDEEMCDGRLVVEKCLDIEGIFYGRDVGYKVEQVRLDKKTEEISGTKIRKEGGLKYPINFEVMLEKHHNIKLDSNNKAI
jgi:cytidyltransferase-like protein